MGWDSIRFEDSAVPGEPMVDEGAGELFVPFGTEAAFYLDLKDGSRLRFEDLGVSEERGRLEVRWTVDGQEGRSRRSSRRSQERSFAGAAGSACRSRVAAGPRSDRGFEPACCASTTI